jgi:hypothetical protein
MLAVARFSSRWASDEVPGISRTFGARASSQASATWTGVTPRRPAAWRTAGAPSTGLPAANAEPSGKNGTYGTPSAAQATLYYQQEPAVTGYGVQPTQEKKQTRVLMTTATSGPAPAGGSADRWYVSVLDFALTRNGRLAMVPAQIPLAAIGLADPTADLNVLSVAQNAVATTQAQLNADQVLAQSQEQTAGMINWIDSELGSMQQQFGYGYIGAGLTPPADLQRENDLLAAKNALLARFPQIYAASLRLGADEAALTATQNALATLSGG